MQCLDTLLGNAEKFTRDAEGDSLRKTINELKNHAYEFDGKIGAAWLSYTRSVRLGRLHFDKRIVTPHSTVSVTVIHG